MEILPKYASEDRCREKTCVLVRQSITYKATRCSRPGLGEAGRYIVRPFPVIPSPHQIGSSQDFTYIDRNKFKPIRIYYAMRTLHIQHTKIPHVACIQKP